MKKLLIYILILIVISFVIPIIFTSKFGEKKETAILIEPEQEKQEDNIVEKENVAVYDYKNYKTVKVLHTEINNVEEIELDKYLYGVVSAEMPASFEEEALKAQAIVARTYTIYKIVNNAGKHEGADICDDSGCCQAWISKEDRFAKWEEPERESNWSKITNAVEETKGKIITYEGKPINAFFHSNSGGTTEEPANVWGGTEYPYLQAVATSGEDAYTQYYSEIILSKEELIQKMQSKYSDFSIDYKNDEEIKITEYNESRKSKKCKDRK